MGPNLAGIIHESARRLPDKTALISDGRAMSYRTLDETARRFAAGLARLGVGRGKHVALLLPNSPEFTVAYFAAHYLAAPVVPLNVMLTPDEIAYHLVDSDAVALIAWDDLLPQAQAGFTRAGSCQWLVAASAGSMSMRTLVEEADPIPDLPETRPDDTAVLLYTSGTTGRPKEAELTHFNLSHNAETVGQRLLRLPEETTALAALPFFHSFGQTVIQNTVLMRGGTVVLMQRFDAVSALELIQGHGVTFFAGVPTMYFELLRHTTMSGLRLEGLTHLMSGGAPMPVEVMKEFERRHDAAILESYGLSETSPVASSNVPDRPRKAGSIGLPIEGIEFKLVDERGDSITDPMVPGEICIKGPNVMKGYYKRPESTAEAIQAGWLRTGDVAHRDEEGYYFIVDRKKDVILRGGFNVYPREVEEALYAHPAIAEAAVVGVRDERLGEEVKAVVALKTGASATEREIIEHCRGRLAAYKCPRIVEFRDSLPKGPTGKILKRVLRDEKG